MTCIIGCIDKEKDCFISPHKTRVVSYWEVIYGEWSEENWKLRYPNSKPIRGYRCANCGYRDEYGIRLNECPRCHAVMEIIKRDMVSVAHLRL